MTDFCGWLKEQGGEWKPVCRAATRDACMKALLAIIPPAQFCEKVVTDGRHPDHRRKPR